MNKFILIIFLFLITQLSGLSQVYTDDLVESTLRDCELTKPEAFKKYDYTSTSRLTIKLSSLKEIISETKIYEGMPLEFRVEFGVYHNGTLIIPKGTIVSARVETIIKSGMNGIPASIIIGGFRFDNVDRIKTDSFYEIIGEDRSLFVFPLKWALTILPPTGSLTNFIKGGHAKMKENQIIEIFYYPDIIKEEQDMDAI